MGIDNKSLEDLARREASGIIPVNSSITRARKTRYNKEIQAAICEGLEMGISIRAVCGAVKIDEKTFYNWKDKHPEFKEAVDGVRPKLECKWLNVIEAAALSGDWKAAAWFLQKRYSDAYGERKEVDVNVNKTDGTEEVLSLVKQVQERLKKPNS